MNWSAFAESWNEYVAKLANGEKLEFTYKSASHLQEAFKKLGLRAQEAATLLSHSRQIAQLRQEHTGTVGNDVFVQQFAPAETAAMAEYCTIRSFGVQTDCDVLSGNEETVNATPAQLARLERPRKRRTKNRSNAKHRCRKCGNVYTDPQWAHLHQNIVAERGEYAGGRPQCRVLRNGEGNKVWDNCQVDPKDYQPGFPCLEGEMPRRPRKKKCNHNVK